MQQVSFRVTVNAYSAGPENIAEEHDVTQVQTSDTTTPDRAAAWDPHAHCGQASVRGGVRA
jgi:hypothetical protein